MRSIKLQFTRTKGNESRPTGHPFYPPVDPETRLEANDVHFEFELGGNPPDGKIMFTKDGKGIGDDPTREIPREAKGLGVEFHKDKNGNVTIRDCHWTDEDDNPIGGIDGYFTPPDGTNDFHINVPGGKITGALWTLNGHYIGGSIKIPKHVNDAHLTPDTRQENTREHAFVPQPISELSALLQAELRKIPVVRLVASPCDVDQVDTNDKDNGPSSKS